MGVTARCRHGNPVKTCRCRDQHSYVETVACLPTCVDLIRENQEVLLRDKKIEAWDKLMELIETHGEVKFQSDHNGIMSSFGRCSANFGMGFLESVFTHDDRHHEVSSA